MAVDPMTIMMGVGILGSLFGGASRASSRRRMGEWEEQQAEFNAAIAQEQATDALYRGEKAAGKLRRQGKGLIGSQRVALAAQGIEIDTGSAGQIQEDTRTLIEQDIQQIRNNAWREAWGFQVQTTDYKQRGRLARRAREFEAEESLLSGGLGALDYSSRLFGK
jgi:hypothetical protein